MSSSAIRKAAVAGSWYPGRASALADVVDRHVAAADAEQLAEGLEDLVAIVAPHAGLLYSGPVAAHAYRQLRGRSIDVAVLVGPSHFASFDGVAIWRTGAFETPLGPAVIDEACAATLMANLPAVHDRPSVHAREHSLEMQLPFLKRIAPRARIVPLLMGWQTPESAFSLGPAIAAAVRGRRAVLVASTDLSHYHDALSAARLDAVLIDHIQRFDAEGLQHALTRSPDHACGGGPTVAVMIAARAAGAREAIVLKYGDSGDVSGDKSSVVGYLAAAFGNRRRAEDDGSSR